MATMGTAIVDFGALPGDTNASVAVVGQAAILSTSFVEAWINGIPSTDHTADEHFVEPLRVVCGAPSAGIGFTIFVICDIARTYGKFNLNWVWV